MVGVPPVLPVAHRLRERNVPAAVQVNCPLWQGTRLATLKVLMQANEAFEPRDREWLLTQTRSWPMDRDTYRGTVYQEASVEVEPVYPCCFHMGESLYVVGSPPSICDALHFPLMYGE